MSKYLAIVAFVLFFGFSHADYIPKCSSGWSLISEQMKNTVREDLSTCQNAKLGFPALNNNLIGGKGSGSLVGIEVGSGTGGCSSDDSCMLFCQAICCMQDGCKFAEVYQSKDVDDYVVYVETVYKYYCRTWSAGVHDGSERTSNCIRPNPITNSNCPAIVQASMFKFNSTTYDALLGLQDNNTCVASGRKLLAPTIKKVPSKAEILGAINAPFANFATLKSKLNATIAKNGVCGAKKLIRENVLSATKC